jgi:hypothetical protein
VVEILLSLFLKKEAIKINKIRGFLNGTRKAYDIDNYIVSGNDVKFQLSNGEQRNAEDFEYLFIPIGEFKNIATKPVKPTRQPRTPKTAKSSDIVEMAVKDG